MHLKGKNAIITGGYRGIGLTGAQALAKNGCNVAIGARNFQACQKISEDLKSEFNIDAVPFYIDVSNPKSVEEAVLEVSSHIKTIDILINAAGISGVQKPVVELEENEFDEVFNIDFKGTFFTSKAVAKIMINQNSGKIINIASILGKIAAPYMLGYCASKAAVLHLTKVMALELARYNIQVNAICPGYFLTDINRDFFDTQRGKQYIQERIPLKRLGQLEELESTIVYLSSTPAFLTGAEIVIDGAQTII